MNENMTFNNKKEDILDICFELSDVFETSNTEGELASNVFELYKKAGSRNGLNFEDLKIYTYNKSSRSLKDFTKSWQNINNDNSKNGLQEAFEFFKNNKITTGILPQFIINGEKIITQDKLADISHGFKKHLKKQNIILFPLFVKEKIFGVLQADFSLCDEKVNLEKDFLKLLSYFARQISRAVKNINLTNRLEVDIKFHETMKNIVKIIETQYELDYILPIMGEMIDKFIPQHLIYVFIKNKKGAFNLIWPSNCHDENILRQLDSFSNVNSTVIEDGGKLGIFPILKGDKSTGAIVAYNRFEILTNAEVKYLEQLTAQASLTVDKAEFYSKILEHATLDALTGLNNRHQFAHRLKQETSTAKRQGTMLCCMMMDIDFFKSVNDRYGHAVGDCVLKTVSKIIKKTIREYDIASRYGGEEFTILTPHTTLDEAYLIAQRLRGEIEKKKINIETYNIKGVNLINVTISIGISMYDPKKHTVPDMLYQDADKALYEAKERGRNRVVVYKEEPSCKK